MALHELFTKETYTEPELAELLGQPKEALAYWRVTSGDMPPFELVHGVPVYWRHEIIRWVESQSTKDEELKLDIFEEEKLTNKQLLRLELEKHPRTNLYTLSDRLGMNRNTAYTYYREWLVDMNLEESPHLKSKKSRNKNAAAYNTGSKMKDENPQKAERPVYTPEEPPLVDESKLSAGVVAGAALGAAMTLIAMAVSGVL